MNPRIAVAILATALAPLAAAGAQPAECASPAQWPVAPLVDAGGLAVAAQRNLRAAP